MVISAITKNSFAISSRLMQKKSMGISSFFDFKFRDISQGVHNFKEDLQTSGFRKP
jgi:hypothetical protein